MAKKTSQQGSLPMGTEPTGKGACHASTGRMCHALQSRLVPEYTPGLQVLTVYNTRVGEITRRYIAYRRTPKDQPLILNYCPWCRADLRQGVRSVAQVAIPLANSQSIAATAVDKVAERWYNYLQKHLRNGYVWGPWYPDGVSLQEFRHQWHRARLAASRKQKP